MAAGREPDRVPEAVAPVGSPKLASARQAEQLEHPRAGDLLGHRGGRVRAYEHAFWPQAVVSQSAAAAAGSDPPTTKPK